MYWRVKKSQNKQMKTTKQKERKPGKHSTYSNYFTPLSPDLYVIIAYFLHCSNY